MEPAVEPAAEDLTGRARMTRNVLSSWGWNFVFIVAGFVMPRVIDTHLKQAGLGVWDFAWSLVAYSRLVVFGVGSSVGRYVAKYRAASDMDGVNRAVSSVTCLFLLLGAIWLGVTVALSLSVPALLSRRLAAFTGEAKLVVLLIGAGLAVRIAFLSWPGVLQGCHRWGLHNAIEGGCYAATVVGMIVVLLLGGGLVSLAWVTLAGDVLDRAVGCVAAHWVCPGLRIRPSQARWGQARGMLGFGGKTFVLGIAELLLDQTVALLVVFFLGPKALAVFTRPKSLMRQSVTLVRKLSNVLTPTTSSLQAMGLHQDIQKLLIRSTRYGAYIALPICLTLMVLGGPVLHVWMGPAYEKGWIVLAILTVGNLMVMIERPARNILAGLNAHGRPGFVYLGAAILAAPMAYLALGPLQWGLTGAAVAVTAALLIANGMYLPSYACRLLNLPLRKYVVKSMRGPVLCTLPYGLCLAAIRLISPSRPVFSLLSAAAAGLIVLVPLYWQYALPESFKRGLIEAMLARLRRRSKADA